MPSYRTNKRLSRRAIPLVLAVIVIFLLFSWKRSSSFEYTLSSLPFDAPIRHVPCSFDWGNIRQTYPVEDLTPLPAGEPLELRTVQFDFATRQPDSDETREQMRERSEAVKELFIKGWSSYSKQAYGMDEVGPLTGGGKTTFGGWGATLVDALDTLWIMGLHDEFRHTARYAAAIDYSRTPAKSINVFETTIRHLGGLLSAYDLSAAAGEPEPALLSKATELGDMLYAAFDTPNRMPIFWLNFRDVISGGQVAPWRVASAGPGSMSLEFTRLSQLTGNNKFYDAIDRVRVKFAAWQNSTALPGMWPVYINMRDEKASDKRFTLGAEADSLYEYLPKMYAMLGGVDKGYADMALQALDVAQEHVVFSAMIPDSGGMAGQDMLFTGDAYVMQTVGSSSKSSSSAASSLNDATGAAVSPGDVRLEGFVQHLGCFAGGMFALAGKLLGKDEYVDVGGKLAMGCAWAYSSTKSGLMPETAELLPCNSSPQPLPAEQSSTTASSHDAKIRHRSCNWSKLQWEQRSDPLLPAGYRRIRDGRYLLRPEAIESMFYLWRITGRTEYRERAWDMFVAVRAATQARWGNAAIESVLVDGKRTKKLDGMESFWFSETLKYFYLMFTPPDVVSLDDYVFNTEAHPFRRPRSAVAAQGVGTEGVKEGIETDAQGAAHSRTHEET